MTTSTLHVSTLHDDDVGSVEVRVLTPPGWTGDTMLPLVLLLHGAASSSEALVRQAEGWEDDWRSGMVPPVIVACASTPTIGGFYLGPWETVVSRSLPSHVETDFGADLGFVAITGASMGGYGALKVAFAEPEKYVAVAAMSPVVFPGHTADDVSSEHRRSVLSNLYAEMIANGYEPNHVTSRVLANVDRIRAADLAIFVECGDGDAYRLYDGAEHLHRTMWDVGISHEYRLLRGVDHLGPEVPMREASARAFIGAALAAATARRA